ncbi:MAG: MFS transporter [Dehalococcoidia bacterium]|jgi:MFS family permease|nr:MFS transporter [Dehalococcoidia bacterium]
MTSSRDRNGANSAPAATASQNGSNGAVTTEELTRATEINGNVAVAGSPPPPATPPTEPRTPFEEPTGIWRTFDSLRDPNFRWFLASMFGHFAAMNTQMFIRGYMVFQLTGSYAYLASIGVAQGVPMLLFALFGGVLADAVPQKKYVVQIGQALNAVNAFVVAFWILTDMIAVEHLLAAAFIQGVINALQMPSRQALTPEVVGMARLTNALGLSTAGMNFNRLVMPGLAGWGLAAINPEEGIGGTEYVYLAMGTAYILAVLAMFRVPTSPAPVDQRRTVRGALEDLIDGFRYMQRTPTVKLLLLSNLLIVTASMPYFMLLAGFVDEVLGASKAQLGFLISIQGVGSLAGSLFIASMAARGRGKMMLLSSLLLGVALIFFAASTNYWLTAGILVIVGLGQSGRMSLGNVLVQSYSEDAYRGRVMSIYMMEFGVTLIGTFFVGMLAAWIGVQWAIGGTAVWLVALVLYLMARTELMRLD